MATRPVRSIVATVRRLLPVHAPEPVPYGPPIEHLAADLRRLLAKHHEIRRSPTMPYRAGRMRAVECALTACALETAQALEIPAPIPPSREPLPPRQLRSVLLELHGYGVLLPGVERFHA